MKNLSKGRFLANVARLSDEKISILLKFAEALAEGKAIFFCLKIESQSSHLSDWDRNTPAIGSLHNFEAWLEI